MTVRPAEPVDLEVLATLWYEGWRDAHDGLLPPDLARRRTLESFRARLEAALPALRVVGPPGSPAGFSFVRDDALCQLYVTAESRGSGIAAALIDEAERRMRDAGVETAWLACAVGNNRAARFYEKRGWRRTGTVLHEPDDSGGNVFEVWRYEKGLNDRD